MTDETTRTCGWCLRRMAAWLRLEPSSPGPTWLPQPIEVCADCWRRVRAAYREELRRGLVTEWVCDGSAPLPGDLRRPDDVPDAWDTPRAGELTSGWLLKRASRRAANPRR